jgi:hypothetical protein
MFSGTMYRGVGHVSTYLETLANFNSKFCHFMTQPGTGNGIHSGDSKLKSRLAGLLVILNEYLWLLSVRLGTCVTSFKQ